MRDTADRGRGFLGEKTIGGSGNSEPNCRSLIDKGGGKNCRKAGAGVYISSRVKRPSFVLTKHHPKKLFIAPCFIFYIFYVVSLFIMYLHNPKLFVVSYPKYFVEL